MTMSEHSRLGWPERLFPLLLLALFVVLPAVSALGQTVPLKTYWSGGRADNFATATSVGEQSALSAGYQFIRIEGYVFPTQQPGTVPLKTYWHGGRNDNFATATTAGEQSAQAAGYHFIRVEGYVYPTQQTGTVPLKLFWSGARNDNFTTATADGEKSAVAAGYQFIRVEGYIFAGPQPTAGTAVPPLGGLTVAQPATGLRPKPPAGTLQPTPTSPPATSPPPPQNSEYAIRLRANNCKFVRVQQTNIMGAVSEMRGPAETLTLVDKNGGDIESGDAVYLRTSDGRFAQASIMQYGGPATVSAGSFRGGAEETFQIYNSAGGPIRHLSFVRLTTTVPGMPLYLATTGSDCQGPDLYAKSQSPGLCTEFIFEAATASWMPQRTAHGPYTVPGNSLLNTGLNVPRCSLVEVQASGTVTFSPIGPIHNPDGENAFPPTANWPAPTLRKYSLICKVGSDLYQCGANASFTPGTNPLLAQSGVSLSLLVNDDLLWDNIGNWQVNFWLTPPR